MFTTPKPYVLVLMPLMGQFDHVYERGIKVACENANTYAERVEKQIYQGSIMQRIYNQIAKADIVVADLTGRSVDVFYGIGYAHALGKRVIILSQRGEDIPYDLTNYTYILYDGDLLNLQRQLEDKIHYYIEHPEGAEERLNFPLAFYTKGVKLTENHPVEVECKLNARDILYGHSQIKFQLDINNRTGVVYDSTYELGIITSADFTIREMEQESIKVSDREYLHLLSRSEKIFPHSWKTIKLEMISQKTLEQLQQNSPFTWILRIFTDVGTIDYPIALKLTKSEGDNNLLAFNNRIRELR